MKSKEYWNKFAEAGDVYSSYNPDDIQLNVLNNIKGKRVLSLGCGAGREVKLLVENNNNVVAVDISDVMIEKSKAIEPKGEYFCEDAVTFAEKNKDGLKFDYIIGLYSFLGYIPKQDRRRLIDNLLSMLKDNGMIIFTLPRIERWQDIAKTMIAWFYIGWQEWGDVFNKDNYWSHHFTGKQLLKLLEGYNFTINEKMVEVWK